MKNIKLILPIFISSLILLMLIYKIDFKKDLIWNLKNTLHPSIIFQLKKIYIYYVHDIKKTITLEKDSIEILESSLGRKFKLIKFQNKIFKKNGPKVFLKLTNKDLFLITGTGVLSYTKIENFNKDKIKLRIIRNNLRKLFNLEKIVKNPGLVLNMNIYDGYIYISYVNEIKKNCFNTSVIRSKINLDQMNFKKFFSPDQCVKKDNNYGEFYILEAGGAMEFFNENNFFLSTGTFRYRDLSQKRENIFGKILLLNLDNRKTKVISMGHRNIQGMFYDKRKDILFSVEHGPQGGDEINFNFSPLNKKIKNYGWPVASYGEHYGGKTEKNKNKYEKAPLLKSHEKYGFIEPNKFFVPSIAPSDILFIPVQFDPNFRNNIYVSSLGFKNDNGRRSIHTFNLNNNFQLENHEIIRLNDRVRDIEYLKKKNFILLFLEKSASIGILKKY
jgi:hypothetical protein